MPKKSRSQNFSGRPKTECELNGVRYRYDEVCKDEHLEKLMQDPKLIKLGEGYIYYINDVINVSFTLHHFFVRRDEERFTNVGSVVTLRDQGYTVSIEKEVDHE